MFEADAGVYKPSQLPSPIVCPAFLAKPSWICTIPGDFGFRNQDLISAKGLSCWQFLPQRQHALWSSTVTDLQRALPMHPHTHTALHASIFLLQTNFNVSSIVTNTETSSKTLPITYCLPTVYLHVLHGRRKVWSWHNSYNKVLVEKNPNPMPCYCYYMNCNFMGEIVQFFRHLMKGFRKPLDEMYFNTRN